MKAWAEKRKREIEAKRNKELAEILQLQSVEDPGFATLSRGHRRIWNIGCGSMLIILTILVLCLLPKSAKATERLHLISDKGDTSAVRLVIKNYAANVKTRATIAWQTDYNRAVALSRTQKKPMLVAFFNPG